MKGYVLLILTILIGMLAAPAAAQGPTETPFPTKAMQYYGRATLMAGIGVKPFHVLETTPFAMDQKVIGQVPEGVSWFKTFMFLAAENGALAWISAVFVSLLVVFVLLAILSHIRRTPTMTEFRNELETRELQIKARVNSRIGFDRAAEIRTSLNDARAAMNSAPWKKYGRGRR